MLGLAKRMVKDSGFEEAPKYVTRAVSLRRRRLGAAQGASYDCITTFIGREKSNSGHTPDHDRSLLISEIQSHRLLKLNRMFFPINANDQIGKPARSFGGCNGGRERIPDDQIRCHYAPTRRSATNAYAGSVGLYRFARRQCVSFEKALATPNATLIIKGHQTGNVVIVD